MSAPQRIVVIGAGICGLSASIWLRRAGHEVTVIDKDHPGAGASFGNAGLLAQWAMVPVNTPDLRKTALKYLLNPNAPLGIQWRTLPGMVGWLRRFMVNATPERTDFMATHIATLTTDSVAQHKALTRGTRAEAWITNSAFRFVYPSRAAFEKDKIAWELRRHAGFVPDLIEGPAVQEAEPMLSPDFGLLAELQGHGHILNPGAYLQDLTQVLQDEGGTYRQAEARDIALEDGRIVAVETDQGRLPCDHAVLATGAWSKPLMRKLGLRVPLLAERGYHLMFRDPSQTPQTPMMITTGKFGVTPMAMGLRCAGTVELGNTSPKRSCRLLRLIAHHVRITFPQLEYTEVEEWMGFRPSTPDSLPLIGEIGQTGVHAAFGHQHVGLTAGPKTGRILAALISGQPPNIDLSPYAANRFSG